MSLVAWCRRVLVVWNPALLTEQMLQPAQLSESFIKKGDVTVYVGLPKLEHVKLLVRNLGIYLVRCQLILFSNTGFTGDRSEGNSQSISGPAHVTPVPSPPLSQFPLSFLSLGLSPSGTLSLTLVSLSRSISVFHFFRRSNSPTTAHLRPIHFTHGTTSLSAPSTTKR